MTVFHEGFTRFQHGVDVAMGGERLTKAQYDYRAEEVEQQIRGQKLLQKELILDAERVKTRQKQQLVYLELNELQAIKHQVKGAEYKAIGEAHKADTAKFSSYKHQIHSLHANNEYQHAKVQTNLQFQQMLEGLRSLEMDVGKQISLNDDKRALHTLEGHNAVTGIPIAIQSALDSFSLS